MRTRETFEPGYYWVKWTGILVDFYQVDGKWWVGKGWDCWYIDNEFDHYTSDAKFQQHFKTWPGCEEKCNCPKG